MFRHCIITEGGIENPAGQSDGAYSLLDLTGSAADVGRAIGDALEECDFGSPGESDLDRGPIFLTLRIAIQKGDVRGFTDSGEGPFDTAADAFHYAYAECGVPYLIVPQGEQFSVWVKDEQPERSCAAGIASGTFLPS